MKGQIFLIPVTLGGDDFEAVIPRKVLEITRGLRYFIVEDTRSARRFLRLIDRNFPIDSSVFYELNKHTDPAQIESYLEAVMNGNNIGLMSEAGLPGIADPGARIISLAHRNKIRVTPLAGPSSIILALISSGLNGQNFTFNGYLPVGPRERAAKLKELEKCARAGIAQVFMETPYRNQQMLTTILEVCNAETLLCIAADITLESESIITMRVSDWRSKIPEIRNKLVIFVLQ
jgi:16S rRNA (cytidine1402-2'-O)-methyltransferase